MSHQLLREAIKAILAEAKPQPNPAASLLVKLRETLFQIATAPNVWRQALTQADVNFNNRRVASRISRQMIKDVLAKQVRVVAKGSMIEVDLPKSRSRIPEASRDAVLGWMRTSAEDFFVKRGWHILTGMAVPNYNHDDSDRRASWTFAPNYTDRVTDVPDVLYHVTSVFSVEQILRQGLRPRSGRDVDGHVQRKYPNRIYVTSDYDQAIELAMAFDASGFDDAMMSGKAMDKSMYVVMSIDATKLVKGTKFFVDPEMSNMETNASFWTYSSIPANAMSLHPSSDEEFEQYKSDIAKDDRL